MIRVDNTSQISLLLLDSQAQWMGFLFRSLVRLLRMEVWEFYCAAPWQCSQHFLPCRSSAAIDFSRNHSSRQSDSSFCINCVLRQFHTALPWFLIIFASSFLSHWPATPPVQVPFPYLVPVFLFLTIFLVTYIWIKSLLLFAGWYLFSEIWEGVYWTKAKSRDAHSFSLSTFCS